MAEKMDATPKHEFVDPTTGFRIEMTFKEALNRAEKDAQFKKDNYDLFIELSKKIAPKVTKEEFDLATAEGPGHKELSKDY